MYTRGTALAEENIGDERMESDVGNDGVLWFRISLFVKQTKTGEQKDRTNLLFDFVSLSFICLSCFPSSKSGEFFVGWFVRV